MCQTPWTPQARPEPRREISAKASSVASRLHKSPWSRSGKERAPARVRTGNGTEGPWAFPGSKGRWAATPTGRSSRRARCRSECSTLEPLRRRLRAELGGQHRRAKRRRRSSCSSRPATRSRTSLSTTSPTGCCSRSTTAPTHPRPRARRAWFDVVGGDGQRRARGAWQHVEPPAHGSGAARTRSPSRGAAMDAFYEEDERILGHAADPYHRIDIRRTSRHLVVRAGDRVVADTHAPLVLYESGFAPRWYVPRADVVADALHRGRRTDVLPVQGHRLLLRHRRRRGTPPGRTALPSRRWLASPTWSRSSPTR